MEFDAEFYFFVGALLLILFFGYIGVHKMIAKGLDGRIEGIEKELAEASRLRAEAQALFDSFAAKTAEAEAQAASIVAQAKTEAEVLAKEAQVASRRLYRPPQEAGRRQDRACGGPGHRGRALRRDRRCGEGRRNRPEILGEPGQLRRPGHRQREDADELRSFFDLPFQKPGRRSGFFLWNIRLLTKPHTNVRA